jgi:hypothetical protein
LHKEKYFGFLFKVSNDQQFKEGQKLEAVDPLEMSRICPATIGKVNFPRKSQIFNRFYFLNRY